MFVSPKVNKFTIFSEISFPYISYIFRKTYEEVLLNLEQDIETKHIQLSGCIFFKTNSDISSVSLVNYYISLFSIKEGVSIIKTGNNSLFPFM